MGKTHFSGSVISAGGFAIGANTGGAPNTTSGPTTTVSYLERGTVSINPASLATGEEADTSVTITGVATGDTIILNPPTAGLTTGIEICGVWVSAANTVKVRLRNNTGGSIDEPAGTWSYMVVRS